MKLAVLILYYNTPNLVDGLTSALPQAIIIDNGSAPDKRYKGRNRCIRFDEPLGFTAGWNMAVKTLWDEFDAFWLMNSDIVITAKTVRAMNRLLENPDIDILTPSYNCWIKDSQNLHTGKAREVKVIEFTAPIIKKKVFKLIGMFDPIFARGYGVEFDFCYRARLKGFRLWVDDANSFLHKGQGTISKHEGILTYSAKANLELNQGMLRKYGPKWREIVFNNVNVKSDFNMKISVYTTIYGDYASLKPVPHQTVTADYYCITDNPNLKCQGWKTVVPDFPRADMHPRLRAKYFKVYPWEVEQIAASEISIFIDGSIQIKSNTFIEYCIKHLTADLLLFKHPQRNCIYEEIEASKPLAKYKSENLTGQGNFYRTFHPKNWGLWACGIMVRKHTPKLKKLMGDWKHEIDKWTYQDQISFPVVCRLNEFKPAIFPDNQYHNDYFDVIWHDDGVPEKVKQQLTVSVLMPVYNLTVEVLQNAVSSVLNQTHQDFELVIAIDCGSAEVLSYITSLQDDRIKITESKQAHGVAAALNRGLEICTGDLILRMDGDDFAWPTLIEKQLQFFAAHPDAVICGVQLKAFGATSFVTHHAAIVTRALAANNTNCWFVNHPGVAYRREVISRLGGYDSSLKGMPEDYDLWCRLLNAGHTIYNQPEVLINYRILEDKGRNPKWGPFLETRRRSLMANNLQTA